MYPPGWSDWSMCRLDGRALAVWIEVKGKEQICRDVLGILLYFTVIRYVSKIGDLPSRKFDSSRTASLRVMTFCIFSKIDLLYGTNTFAGICSEFDCDFV